MDHENPTVSFVAQRNARRRQLWDQFIKKSDPYERERFYRLIAPYPRKRFLKALTNLLIVLERTDRLLAATGPPSKS
jgi:hypothetical protein